MAQLEQAGAEKIFREVASGAKTDRAQLRRALDRLEQGDVLLVTRFDTQAQTHRTQTAEAIKQRDTGEPMREIAASYNVSHSTISRLAV